MRIIMSDMLSCIIPKFYGIVNLNGVEFIKMEHLTEDKVNTSVMDVKLGSKTYLKTDEGTKLRNDLYKKVRPCR